MPQFTLAVVATADGFIARHPADSPAAWASPEEQDIFLRHVDAADWSVMGRHTHEAADKPQRRRIVFSRHKAGWQRPTQLWLDPTALTPQDLPGLVDPVHPLARGLILGGTMVHDWFHAHGAIDEIALTIEPLTFERGLPLFTGQHGDPLQTCRILGYAVETEAVLNPRGTRYLTLKPR